MGSVAKSSSTEDESALFPQLLQAMGRVTLQSSPPSPAPVSPKLESMPFAASNPGSPLASVNEDGQQDLSSSQDHTSSADPQASGSDGQSSSSSLSLRNTPYSKSELILDIDGTRYFVCPIPTCGRKYRCACNSRFCGLSPS